MLFDTDKMKVITIVTKDPDRKDLYEKIKKELKILNKLDNIIQYLDIEIEKYFNHYEDQGLIGHLKAVYICGSNWEDTPIEEIYNLIRINYSNNEAFELSKQMIGCFLRESIIKSITQYECTYYPKKGYIYSR